MVGIKSKLASLQIRIELFPRRNLADAYDKYNQMLLILFINVKRVHDEPCHKVSIHDVLYFLTD